MSQSYDELMDKALDIYNNTLWPPEVMNKPVTVMSAKSHDKGIDLSFNKNNKIESIRLNHHGQVVGYGVIKNPYSGEPIPEKDIKALNNAIELFNEAIKICPARGSPYKWIGRIYQHLSLYDEAKKYYKIAIKLHPQFKQELNSRIEECKDIKEGEKHIAVELNEEEIEEQPQKFKYINLNDFNNLLSSAKDLEKNEKLRDSIDIYEKIEDLMCKKLDEMENDEGCSDKEYDFAMDNMLKLRVKLAELYYLTSYKLKGIEDLLYHPAFDGGNQEGYYWLLKLYEKNNNTKDVVMCLNSIKKLSKDCTIGNKLKNLIKDIQPKISKEQINKANEELLDDVKVEVKDSLFDKTQKDISIFRGGIDIVNSASPFSYSESNNKMYLLAIGDNDGNEDESKLYFLANRKQVVWEKDFNFTIGQVFVSNSGISAVIVDSEEKPEFTKEELEEGWENEGLNPNKLLIFDKNGNKIMDFRGRNSLIVTANMDPEGNFVACATAFPENSAYLLNLKEKRMVCKKNNVHRSVINKIVFYSQEKIKFITDSKDSFMMDIKGNLVDGGIQEGGQTKYYRFYHEGYSYFDNKDYEKAEKIFLEAIKNYKPHTGLLNVLANAEYKLGKHKEAIEFWKKAISLSKSIDSSTSGQEKQMIRSYRNLIDNNIYKKNFDEAKKIHEEMKISCLNHITKRDNEKIKKAILNS